MFNEIRHLKKTTRHDLGKKRKYVEANRRFTPAEKAKKAKEQSIPEKVEDSSSPKRPGIQFKATGPPPSDDDSEDDGSHCLNFAKSSDMKPHRANFARVRTTAPDQAASEVDPAVATRVGRETP